ncbi:hypothetical protein ACHAWU_005022 [Discostella pseudostelligera]|uniref:Uncharacterized protein n=1 Tax=Discostella pseudostelligera TaxID=259834 RepID=A0ABD3M3W0_9STRA
MREGGRLIELRVDPCPGVQSDGMIPYPTCNQFGDDNVDAKNYSRK